MDDNKTNPPVDRRETGGSQTNRPTRPGARTRWVALAVILVAVASLLVYKMIDARQTEKPPETVADVLDVTFSFDLDALKERQMPMLIDFGSESCAPCRAMKPALIEINRQYQGKAIVKYIDVWEDTAAGANFPISAVPTQFFFYADGKPYLPPDNYADMFIQYTLKTSGEHVLTAHVGGLSEAEMQRILSDLGA